eukprot:GHVU01232772.1.p1 GENE.GHVU01232772.1~~GHVU01232772.1.p1  ORF type:complete len:196 (+),score=0.65 GHVU01232772.1:1662-2249(+)
MPPPLSPHLRPSLLPYLSVCLSVCFVSACPLTCLPICLPACHLTRVCARVTGSSGVALMLVKAAQTAVPEEERRSMLTSAHNLVHSATVRDRPTFLMGPTGISCIQVRARVSASVCVWYVYVYVYVSYVCASYVGRLLTYARSECVGRVCPHRILPRARVLGMDGCVRVCVRMCVRMCMCVGVCVGVCVRVCVCE